MVDIRVQLLPDHRYRVWCIPVSGEVRSLTEYNDAALLVYVAAYDQEAGRRRVGQGGCVANGHGFTHPLTLVSRTLSGPDPRPMEPIYLTGIKPCRLTRDGCYPEHPNLTPRNNIVIRTVMIVMR